MYLSKKLKKNLQAVVRTTLPLLLGIAILGGVYSQMDIQAIGAILKGEIQWGWIIGSTLFLLLSHLLRALRWQLLLESAGESASLRHSFLAITSGYGVNIVLPRVGEITRCVSLNKSEGTSISKAAGTVVAERAFDMLVLALIMMIGMAGEWSKMTGFFLKHQPTILTESWYELLLSPYLYLGLGVVGLLSWATVAILKRAELYQKVISIARNIWKGFGSFRKVKHRGLFISLSLGIWVCFFLEFYFAFWAFPFLANLQLFDIFIIFIMGSLAFIVPIQGGVGPWHFMIISSMTLFYGIQVDQAGAFAFAVNTLQNLCTLLYGVVALLLLAKQNQKH